MTLGDAGSRYTLLSVLGQGGMGVVYRARQRDLDRDVAIKFLPEDILRANPVAVERFWREARACTTLVHPNIVKVLDVGERGGQPYLVMELIQGEDLAARLRRTGPLEWPLVAGMLEQILDALDHCHAQGFVHRDIKPSNIVLEASGRAVLMDFGLVLAVDRTVLTRAGTLLGTPRFVAPEVLVGQDSSPVADLWSLGVTAWEVLSNRDLFEGGSIKEIFDGVETGAIPPPRVRTPLPPAMVQWLMGMLERDPTRRPATAALARETLLRAVPAQSRVSVLPVQEPGAGATQADMCDGALARPGAGGAPPAQSPLHANVGRTQPPPAKARATPEADESSVARAGLPPPARPPGQALVPHSPMRGATHRHGGSVAPHASAAHAPAAHASAGDASATHGSPSLRPEGATTSGHPGGVGRMAAGPTYSRGLPGLTTLIDRTSPAHRAALASGIALAAIGSAAIWLSRSGTPGAPAPVLGYGRDRPPVSDGAGPVPGQSAGLVAMPGGSDARTIGGGTNARAMAPSMPDGEGGVKPDDSFTAGRAAARRLVDAVRRSRVSDAATTRAFEPLDTAVRKLGVRDGVAGVADLVARTPALAASVDAYVQGVLATAGLRDSYEALRPLAGALLTATAVPDTERYALLDALGRLWALDTVAQILGRRPPFDVAASLAPAMELRWITGGRPPDVPDPLPGFRPRGEQFFLYGATDSPPSMMGKYRQVLGGLFDGSVLVNADYGSSLDLIDSRPLPAAGRQVLILLDRLHPEMTLELWPPESPSPIPVRRPLVFPDGRTGVTGVVVTLRGALADPPGRWRLTLSHAFRSSPWPAIRIDLVTMGLLH